MDPHRGLNREKQIQGNPKAKKDGEAPTEPATHSNPTADTKSHDTITTFLGKAQEMDGK